MRPIIQVPRLNPINFRPNIQPDDNRIHSRGMLQDLYYNRIHEWEDKYQWFLPCQTDDPQRLQFNISIDENVKIELINCYGQVQATYSPMTVFELQGNRDDILDSQLYTHYFIFDFAGIAEGYYYLLLTAGDGTPDNTKQELSEPVHIAATHPDTRLISYRANKNTSDPVIFEQTNCIFNLRLNGVVKTALPDFESNSYKNQRNNTTQVYYQPSRTYEIFFDLIPDYIHDTLNFALGLDYVLIDNIQYALDEGAKWENGITDNAPLRSPSIVLRESDPHAGTIDRTIGALLLVSLPKDYPFALQALGMGIRTPNIDLLPFPRILRSDGDRDLLILFLNALRAGLGLDGTFTYTTTAFSYDVYYNNTALETYAVASRRLAFNLTGLSISVSALVNSTFAFGFTQGLITVAWGDGSPAFNYTAGSSSVTAGHSYANGNYTAQIFGSFESLITFDSTTGSYLANITGLLPTGLKELSLSGTSITTFNANVLANTTNTLAVLILKSGSLTTVSNLPNYTFFLLKKISFSLNRLPTSQVNDLVNAVNINTTNAGLYSGRLDLNNQTPPVGNLSVSAQFARTNLRNNYLWTVNT